MSAAKLLRTWESIFPAPVDLAKVSKSSGSTSAFLEVELKKAGLTYTNLVARMKKHGFKAGSRNGRALACAHDAARAAQRSA